MCFRQKLVGDEGKSSFSLFVSPPPSPSRRLHLHLTESCSARPVSVSGSLESSSSLKQVGPVGYCSTRHSLVIRPRRRRRRSRKESAGERKKPKWNERSVEWNYQSHAIRLHSFVLSRSPRLAGIPSRAILTRG